MLYAFERFHESILFHLDVIVGLKST